MSEFIVRKKSELSSKDIFINEVMLEANTRKILVTRKEVELCIDFYIKIGGYFNRELILNTLELAINNGVL